MSHLFALTCESDHVEIEGKGMRRVLRPTSNVCIECNQYRLLVTVVPQVPLPLTEPETRTRKQRARSWWRGRRRSEEIPDWVSQRQIPARWEL